MLATTKQVRALVHGLCSVRAHSYTDKSKRGSDRRNVTFMLCEDKQLAELDCFAEVDGALSTLVQAVDYYVD